MSDTEAEILKPYNSVASVTTLLEEGVVVDRILSPEKESWCNPRKNTFKVYTLCFGFVIFGMNDASIGAIVEHLEIEYQIDHATVSLAFLFSFAGYITSAISAELFHQKLGRGGVSRLGILAQIFCYALASTKPPFYMFAFGYSVSGFGKGLLEASWNSWAGNLKNENEILGLLHACFGIGGMLSPAIETVMIAAGHQWNSFYYIILAMACMSFINSYFAFQDSTPEEYLKSIQTAQDQEQGKLLESSGNTYGAIERHDKIEKPPLLSMVATNKLVWLFASTFFFYVGAEVTLGGWITTFMIAIRHGSVNQMGYITTAFWGGITVGRLALSFLGGKIRREQALTMCYMSLSTMFFAMFWIFPSLEISAAMIALVGFFMGPLFPTIVIVFMQKIPRNLQILGMGFATSFGGIGAAFLPFINGWISSIIDPSVLCPLAFTLLFSMSLCWIAIMKYF